MQPKITHVPDVLLDLSHADIFDLRPSEFHNCDYFRAENGFRKKEGIFELSWSTIIEQIRDVQSRNKCLNAYNYLMNEPRSCYRDFVNKSDNVFCPKEKINVQVVHRIDISSAVYGRTYILRENSVRLPLKAKPSYAAVKSRY